ncbi:Chromatin structure-remodeling complex protein rsc9 [Teratosphaeriaceae sp. CCFEE 6253]|nr:Chromatin structure-remodeling complex protein rsc9 [Teratosphaeriaceae sp. CCFEE 6253]
MVPKRGESIERTTEHEDFMEKLAAYHEERGTNLEHEPKVGVRHVDLRNLYARVVEEGGYDLCSDTKAKPLMWRRFAEEFVGKNQYTAAQAFQIKNVYYKNLVAYEITHHWKQEPPPKEILEDVTAKGGNVMTRTFDNFEKPPKKEEVNLGASGSGGGSGGGEGSDASPEQKTPKLEKTEEGDELDPGSASGRMTRGLRHAPPQRVLFQPDLAAQGRQTRGAVNAANSPTPGAGGLPSMVNGSGTASSTLASYEPSQSYPLSLKPVITPANNPDHYRQQLKRKADSAMGPLAKKYKNIMLPGTGFTGPNIYVRAQLALQSGIDNEEMYALHHLVKISHERGDKYRFDQFAGLAEALIRKCMSVCGLFYDVEWDTSYNYDTMDADDETLDGLRGTSDIVRRLQNMIPKVTDDGMQDPAFSSQLNRIMEAGLVLRNMCLQAENAKYLVNIPTTRDYLSAALTLPSHPGIVELQHYALETAEQLLVWCDLGPRDGLYRALIAQLEGQDRTAIIIALRTIARIGMHLPHPKRLDDVPAEILQRVQDWLMTEDEEMKGACLDFLFQYTSSADNVANVLHALDAGALANQLSRLLLFAAKEERKATSTAPADDRASDKGPYVVPRLSRNMVELLLTLEEPERSSEWLRMCFASDPTSEITQIALWQSYQATFTPFNTPTRNHLVAGEFIKNVSTTFAGATAQVAGGGKYVIRGIRARRAPVEAGLLPGSGVRGEELGKCRWMMTHEQECKEWFRQGDEAMMEHVLRDHLVLPRRAAPMRPDDEADGMEIDSGTPGSRPASAMASVNGTSRIPGQTASLGARYDFAAADQNSYRCCWAGGCHRSSADFEGVPSMSRTALLARHIRVHLPDADPARARHNVRDGAGTAPRTGDRTVYQGLVDEKGDATGVPLSAALVLRNLAKFMPASGVQTVPMALSDGTAGPVGGMVDDAVHGAALNSKQKDGAGQDEDGDLMAKVFDDEVVERLMWALTCCKPIHAYVGSVLRAIGRGGGS